MTLEELRNLTTQDKVARDAWRNMLDSAYTEVVAGYTFLKETLLTGKADKREYNEAHQKFLDTKRTFMKVIGVDESFSADDLVEFLRKN